MQVQGAILNVLPFPCLFMKVRYRWMLLAAVLLCSLCWWSRGTAVIERPADGARVSCQPEEWMEDIMLRATTVLRLRLEQEHVQVNTQGFCHYNIVFHAVVEECILGNIPAGARVQVEAADIEESLYQEANEAFRAERSLEMKLDHANRRAWLILPPDEGLTAVPAENLYFWNTGVSLGMPGLWWGERTEALVQKYLPLWLERRKTMTGS